MSSYHEFRRRSLKRRMWQKILNTTAIVLAVLVVGGGGWYALTHFDVLDASSTSAQSQSTSSAQEESEVTPEPEATEIPITAQTSIATPNETDANWNTASYAIRVLNTEVQPQGDGTTAMDFRLAGLGESGEVVTSYFDSVTFLGDSITQGLYLYTTGLPNANYCAYKSITPASVVNGTTVTNVNGDSEIALDALVESAPDRVYILLGMNALTSNSDYTSFLAYYSEMIDMIQERLPGILIYVQSVTPVRPSVSATSPGLYSARLMMVNDELAALALSKGCEFLNLWEVLADENGDFKEEYAAADGIHMNATGYAAWVEYLCTHTLYTPGVSYVAGTSYYIEQ